ncbi:helix-turn-helix domain-containing protein [Klebsiella pneumoniae]|nr:helix-turn-helix transcriptional regulator [Klebsiella pneumoniae]
MTTMPQRESTIAVPDDRRKQLGAFLRARRESLDPQRLGLPRVGRRRTPGLRREEVAMLADVGVTWYTWLEQGREVNPSEAVLVARLLSLFSHSALMRILLPALLAVACYGWGFRRQRRETQWHYSTEAILFLGVVFTAVALWQLGERLDNGSGHIAPLFLAGCVIYGAIGYIARSGLVWLFFLLALGNWFGAETGYVSGWGAYWLGMNYPIRFVLFGGALLALCYGAQSLLRQRQLFTVSKAMGLTYLFIALWILSIFGNYDADSWYQVSQARLLPWGLLFAVAAGVCIFISLKTDDGMLRGFGLTFLAINLYTRFFEFFWNGMHKVLFFLILAVSLAVIGRYAERIWHAGNVKP